MAQLLHDIYMKEEKLNVIFHCPSCLQQFKYDECYFLPHSATNNRAGVKNNDAFNI